MSQTTLSASHLSRNFGARRAVQDISIELRRGEVLGLLGQNGAGKSTVMQMLAGTLAPSSGSIAIGGIDLAGTPAAAKALLGYLPEHPPLYPEMRVDDYLAFAAKLRKVADPAAAATRAKERCGLAGEGRRLIGRLSKGYRQRIGIAQAIVHNPQVLILDEPGSGLDPLQLREIRKLIRELGDECSVIFSSHTLAEVESLCDRLLVLKAGECVFSGLSGELSAEPGGLEAAFVRLTGTEAAA
jgi:ABC-2 type transport system ATP-binding protein